MCFAELDENKLTFSLPSGWQGTVEVTFTGTNKKLVEISWGSLGSTSCYYCDNPSGGTYTIPNTAPNPMACEITVSYDTTPCIGGTPIIPAVNSSELNCETRSMKHLGSWNFDCPDSTNAVGITVVIEENTTGS
ncbi:MAG: hypothetical protein AB7H80_02320 [Candidatus Kapaibacterium sp.]